MSQEKKEKRRKRKKRIKRKEEKTLNPNLEIQKAREEERKTGASPPLLSPPSFLLSPFSSLSLSVFSVASIHAVFFFSFSFHCRDSVLLPYLQALHWTCDLFPLKINRYPPPLSSVCPYPFLSILSSVLLPPLIDRCESEPPCALIIRSLTSVLPYHVTMAFCCSLSLCV